MFFVGMDAPKYLFPTKEGVCKPMQVSHFLFSMTKTEHRISSAYHPQSNGLVERFNQTIHRSLVKVVNENQTDWDIKLEGVLFAFRTSQQKSTGLTPFELMYCW